MAPKSGEVDTVEGGNTEPEKTKLSELATEMESLTVGKHKAVISAESAANEDLDEEDEEEEEDEDDDNEEDDEEEEEMVDEDSCESDQEWDVDSFKDVEFNSEDEEDDEEWRRYVRQCYKSEGFDVPVHFLPQSSTRIYIDAFNPVKLDKYFGPPELTGRMYMDRMVKVVIAKYNESKGKNLELVEIVRTVVKMAIGVKAYITFMARESPEGEPVEYQGKAEWRVWQRNIHPLLCRPASEQRKRD